ncbi:TRNA-dihydrouridine(47) synthase [NAD(P)(+)]-like [Actinidia chinensis var. chinensis]|uniref:tRNA-dihydrouridine(47) synthase [NAD(P)(+)] n=1 Tax=Actinidia chinensis var. chinensis TaxID=1590841 RepID=A0A2R6RBS0_ACTCC|nr:TRNA-dihydrouridine(47) synthase [NAD(P)(+)]-like [Actinidia chinensis var. chinensis]
MDDGPTAELAGEEPKVSYESHETPSVVIVGGGVVQQTPEDLVAKAIAPVKREFLLPPPIRPCSKDSNDVASDATKSAPSNLLKEKKSKRQLKRERLQEKKSVLHLCPEVARSGDPSTCRYNDKCRFSHDIEAFKDQKPADLEGDCPFLNNEGPCPYGLTCRFSGTHKDGLPAEAFNGQKKSPEMNGLNKDVQKLLWKNNMKFPKADAQLKLLGLLGHMKSVQAKLSEEEEGDRTTPNRSIAADENGGCEVAGDTNIKMDHSPQPPEEDDCAGGTFASDELRPPKKAKSSVDENHSRNELDNGIGKLKKDIEKSCSQNETGSTADCIPAETDGSLKSHPREKKLIDFREKLYLAPLTTVGNLPFRRVCKVLGADVTCGEMAMCTNLLQGQASEWALLRRHSSEDLFGVQICGAYPDTVTRTVELIDQECTVDFIDINMGCPIDIVVNKGAGSALLMKPMRMKSVVQAASAIVDRPITVKVRTGYFEGRNRIDSLIENIGQWGASAVTIHGRSRQQRYSKLADWEYIYQCTRKAPDALQVLGNGDVFSYLDWNTHKSDCPELSTCMIARGALIKPWIFTEIKEQRHWDISSGERLNIMKDYVRFGLDHWGSDAKGVETTRHFLLEWLSYTFRYIPVGLLDVIPQRLNWRPPSYFGRDDLETLMASESASDWVRISEMLLGKVPAGFTFAPKHKSNAYDRAENG